MNLHCTCAHFHTCAHLALSRTWVSLQKHMCHCYSSTRISWNSKSMLPSVSGWLTDLSPRPLRINIPIHSEHSPTYTVTAPRSPATRRCEVTLKQNLFVWHAVTRWKSNLDRSNMGMTRHISDRLSWKHCIQLFTWKVTEIELREESKPRLSFSISDYRFSHCSC